MEHIVSLAAPCAMIGVVALIIVALFLHNRARADRIAMLWEGTARDLGLAHSRPQRRYPGEISGTYNGFEVRVWMFTRGSGKSRQTWTAVQTSTQLELGTSLKIQRENVLTELGKMLGMQDIQTGDEKFDKKFQIKAGDQGAALGLLTSNLRRDILRYDRITGCTSLSDTGAYLELRGWQTDTAFVKGTLTAQFEVVQSMHRAAANIQTARL